LNEFKDASSLSAPETLEHLKSLCHCERWSLFFMKGTQTSHSVSVTLELDVFTNNFYNVDGISDFINCLVWYSRHNDQFSWEIFCLRKIFSAMHVVNLFDMIILSCDIVDFFIIINGSSDGWIYVVFYQWCLQNCLTRSGYIIDYRQVVLPCST